MTTQELERSIQEIWKLFKETDKEIKETNKEIKETNKEIERVSSSVDKLTGKWGRFVEGMVVPAVKGLFKTKDIMVEKIFQRVKAHKNGKNMEIDIMAINQEHAVLIETKSTLGVDDVKDHLERLREFKEFFPEYQEKKVLGAVAGIVIEDGADRYAYRQGLFVIGQTGDTVTIFNDEKFRPRFW
jgi:hypothetical protein